MSMIAAQMDANPHTAQWTESFLVEAAKNPDPAFIRSWLASSGYPEGLIDSTLAAGVEPHFEAVAQQRLDELIGEQTPEALYAGAQAKRDAASKVIERGNAAMRAPQGSPEWNWYHREGGDRSYYQALKDSESPGELLAAASAAMPTMPVAAPPVAAPPEPADPAASSDQSG